MNVEPLFGVLAFLSFAASVVAAVLAIDMYALSRTGEFGPAWRVLIIASVMFALVQALRIASYFDWYALQRYGLSQIAELMFALALAYAFYLQRHVFSSRSALRRDKQALEPADEDDEPLAMGLGVVQDDELDLDEPNDESLEVSAPANGERAWPRLK